jgi:hypothetical protein
LTSVLETIGKSMHAKTDDRQHQFDGRSRYRCYLALAIFFFGAPAAFAVDVPPDNRASLAAHNAFGITEQAIAAGVVRVRVGGGLASSIPSSELDTRLVRLVSWMAKDYAQNGQLRLLSAAPEGVNAAGATNQRLKTLQHTYWLQDNGLYGAGALLEYAPDIGRELSTSWRSKWERYFPTFCPDTESDFVVGVVPAYERSGEPKDRRCQLKAPGRWSYLRMYQYPSPANADFDSRALPIIGTDYPADDSGQTREVPIKQTAVRDLLKYGCLRQVALGNPIVAEQMFDLALSQWDGNGFFEQRQGADQAGTYWTRDLAFALMCANALGRGQDTKWGTQKVVAKADIEARLWSAQSADGGIWTNYCSASEDCGRSGIPTSAKLTNEIAPLILLAYGANIWAHPHEAPGRPD